MKCLAPCPEKSCAAGWKQQVSQVASWSPQKKVSLQPYHQVSKALSGSVIPTSSLTFKAKPLPPACSSTPLANYCLITYCPRFGGLFFPSCKSPRMKSRGDDGRHQEGCQRFSPEIALGTSDRHGRMLCSNYPPLTNRLLSKIILENFGRVEEAIDFDLGVLGRVRSMHDINHHGLTQVSSNGSFFRLG